LRDTVALDQINRISNSEIAARGRKHFESSAEWQHIKQRFFATSDASEAQRSLAKLLDAAVIESYQSSLAPVLSEPAAVLATGSFARSELFPFDQADIVIVYQGDTPANLNQAVVEFVRLLWERGVRPSQRVCSIAQCLAFGDQQVDRPAKLLDRRLLTGDPTFAAKLDGQLAALLTKEAQRLAQRLIALARARHAKYHNEPSRREPDIRDAPGGLQDLRLIADLERLCSGRLESTPKLEKAAAFLSSVQCFLHYWADEEHSILDETAQEAFVKHFASGLTAPVWLREYFKEARVVFQHARRALESLEATSSALLDGMRDWQSRLSTNEFSVLNGRVYLRRPGELDAETIFRLLEFVARHGISPALETQQRLEASNEKLAAYCSELRPLWPAIRSVLSLPHADQALRVLDNTGLLSSMFPEWTAIEGEMAPNLDHRYSVDAHVLTTIEQVCELPRNTARQRFAELLAQVEDRALVLFALLFHQMGVSEKGPYPWQKAVTLAGEASARIQMAAPDREMISFLVKQQSVLWDALRGRDLGDPATILVMSRQLGTIERLRMLAVMTYGQITATYPDSTLPWRLEQLWRIYLAIERELTRGLETDRIQEAPASFSESADFIKGFPMRYLRARTAEEIAAHTRLFQLSQSTGVSVQLQQLEGAYEVTVIARDMPALFASLAGAISSFGLDILNAEAFSNTNGIVLDTFVIADRKRTFHLNPSETERLQDLIRRIALGKTDVRRLFRNQVPLPPKKRAIAPQVRFDSSAHETATLVEIVADDQPGLLYRLATVFSSNDCNIDTVLIDTKAHRALDVFYVAQEGKKLSSELETKLKEQLLAACM
jgi:[protein-PII] uridylyltransferase